MDYKKVGLKAGIEIHQQLDTREKLFCGCPTLLRKTEEHEGEFFRYLRATESEMGEIDQAAQEEMKREREFHYFTYDTTCLVEYDEEPPAPLNEEALSLCLMISKLLHMTPIEQVHVMRKLVIDGSNTSGFQRTALVAVNGMLPGGGIIETICLEEEAAQRVRDDIFSLDRLGIPLVEITTSPCMHTPEEVQETAEFLGMVLRSTGRVKRGLGTIRQDVNISISAGARVEIKGVQELALIAEVVQREVERQTALLWIRDELRERCALVDHDAVELTALFTDTKSAILRKAPVIRGVLLKGFSGLVGREIQPGRRLGSELSDYAKKCGLGGIFHTDELPAYGISADEVSRIRVHMGAGVQDCIIIVAGPSDRTECAVRQVIRRAEHAIAGIPEETRKMLEDGSTAYMRPLPGAARMYPETDVLPVMINRSEFDALVVPELLTVKAERFQKIGLDEGTSRQIAFSDRLPLFECAIAEGLKPQLVARTILATLKELAREGLAVRMISDDLVLRVLLAVEEGRAAKEAIPAILSAVASGRQVDEAVRECAPVISEMELARIVSRVVAERADFVQARGKAALGPLMGVVMEEVRGSVDGKRVSALLKKEIERMLS